MKRFWNKKILFLSLLVTIFVFLGVNIITLNTIDSKAFGSSVIQKDVDDYWKGTTDQNLAQIKQDIHEIKNSLREVCRDVTNIQIQAAKTGALYGGGGGIGVYLLGLLGQLLLKNKKKGN